MEQILTVQEERISNTLWLNLPPVFQQVGLKTWDYEGNEFEGVLPPTYGCQYNMWFAGLNVGDTKIHLNLPKDAWSSDRGIHILHITDKKHFENRKWYFDCDDHMFKDYDGGKKRVGVRRSYIPVTEKKVIPNSNQATEIWRKIEHIVAPYGIQTRVRREKKKKKGTHNRPDTLRDLKKKEKAEKRNKKRNRGKKGRLVRMQW
eukprot:314278_1